MAICNNKVFLINFRICFVYVEGYTLYMLGVRGIRGLKRHGTQSIITVVTNITLGYSHVNRKPLHLGRYLSERSNYNPEKDRRALG